jgi:hypothetical protein
LDLNPEIINHSPVLQRWLKKIPNILEEIKHNPSFTTKVRLGYAQFPSQDDSSGITVGVEDVFIGSSGLTIDADYQTSFRGDARTSAGANLNYYVLPLGSYVNISPVLGYRYFQRGDYSTEGVNLGGRVRLSLSPKGAADITLSQTFLSPGGSEEIGFTTFSAGYALTPNLRISADIQKQNSSQHKDESVTLFLEWMPKVEH